MEKLNVAVVGATGLVGEAIVSILEERNFPIETLIPLASVRSAGRTMKFREETIPVMDLQSFDFNNTDLCFFSAGSDVSNEFAPKAAEQGAVVIDNTACFRYEDDIPLVVPEVNPEAVQFFSNRNIIANPNCSTIQLVVALAPIHNIAKIKRINVATYQSISGAGRKALDLLNEQTQMALSGDDHKQEQSFAFNVIPQIDTFQKNDFTKEEMKLVWETQKIFNDYDLLVNATAVRVPVRVGHSEAVSIQTERVISPEQIRQVLTQSQGIEIIDDTNEKLYPTPLIHGENTNVVYVGRIRKDYTLKNGINLWVVADNIRKGAALNSVQIAEVLIKNYF